MSRFFTTKVTVQDSPSIDALSRWRVSNTSTLFDTKLIHSAEPEFWDDQEVSGSGTSSTHDPDRASVSIGVSVTTAGKRVRQTFARPNSQPGKSKLVSLTGIIGGLETGITREIGNHDDDNGLFFRNLDGDVYIGRKTSVTGSAVDNMEVQTSWNLDPMNGTGKSKITLDFTKIQTFVIDDHFGAGRIRFGFQIDGLIVYCHELLNANNLDAVYMSTPNNPLRYSIENDGTGAVADMEGMESSIVSEGSQEESGVDYYYSTDGTHVDANASGTIYAVLGIRLQIGNKGSASNIKHISLFSETNDNYEWLIYRNPTVAGVFTYTDAVTGPFQIARGATANVVTPTGDPAYGGYGSVETAEGSEIVHESGFGEAIDGTRDEFILCVRPLSSNADIQGGIILHTNH